MAIVRVPTSYNIEVELTTPPFHKRLLALAIDYVLLFIYMYLAAKLYNFIEAATGFGQGKDYSYNANAVSMLLFVLPVISYHFVSELLMGGQTIGKRLLKLKVISQNGSKASIGQLAIRWLIRDIWFLFLLFIGLAQLPEEGGFILILSIGYFAADILIVTISKTGQRIGDILAKTLLINTVSSNSIEETVFEEVEENYTPVFPVVMSLSDRDINTIKNILSNPRRTSRMTEISAEKIKSHLQIQSEMASETFLATLLKDYNYLSVHR